MRLINDEDDGATEPLYAQSDDEHGALKAKAGRYSDRKRALFIWSFAVICYLILMGMYVKLWIRFKELESEVHSMKPDLFPCMVIMRSL